MPPESAVPNNEAASCLINVRGEEQRCILGVAHEHPARGDAAAEDPWRRSGKEASELQSVLNGRKQRRTNNGAFSWKCFYIFLLIRLGATCVCVCVFTNNHATSG